MFDFSNQQNFTDSHVITNHRYFGSSARCKTPKNVLLLQITTRIFFYYCNLILLFTFT